MFILCAAGNLPHKLCHTSSGVHVQPWVTLYGQDWVFLPCLDQQGTINTIMHCPRMTVWQAKKQSGQPNIIHLPQTHCTGHKQCRQIWHKTHSPRARLVCMFQPPTESLPRSDTQNEHHKLCPSISPESMGTFAKLYNIVYNSTLTWIFCVCFTQINDTSVKLCQSILVNERMTFLVHHSCSGGTKLASLEDTDL